MNSFYIVSLIGGLMIALYLMGFSSGLGQFTAGNLTIDSFISIIGSHILELAGILGISITISLLLGGTSLSTLIILSLATIFMNLMVFPTDLFTGLGFEPLSLILTMVLNLMMFLAVIGFVRQI